MKPQALIGLMWLASPALPVGGFSYSDGLEAAIDAGAVHDEASTAEWLSDQLHLALARSDLPLVAAAHAAWCAHDEARIGALNAWALATRETAELRAQSEQMGRSMLEWLRLRAGDDARVALLARPLPAWPVAFALGTALAGAVPADAALAFGFAWAENQVQAALKAVPLGQSAGQRVLARLARELEPLAQAAPEVGDGQRQAFAPLLAVHSARHETQYSRLFRS